jgi:glycosyltransferase involved in cell wall biosynthesis
MVLLTSTSATGAFAASWAARLSGVRAGVQVVLHGNLTEAIHGWRSRNPLARLFDMRSALTARYPVPLRFIVLEHTILDALDRFIPDATKRVDVIPHPINASEMMVVADSILSAPVRIGFVGLGTADKGIDTFLRLARRSRARWSGRVEFVHVGHLHESFKSSDFSDIKYPPMFSSLTRNEFRNRLKSLHYILLPFRRGYYDLSASGAILDAITWLKPIIATRVPLTEYFFSEYPDIGFLCDGEEELEKAIEEIMLRVDTSRYDRQVDALKILRADREIRALATHYHDIVAKGFPSLLS